MTAVRAYSRAEQWAHTLSHGFGLLLALAGATALVARSAGLGSAWPIVACAVYGATLVLLYGASTLYHALDPRRRWPRLLDHAAIYLLIAGTYTPFLLLHLRGPWGWSLFGVVWGGALAGMLLVLFSLRLPAWVASLPYLLMGWACLVALRPFLEKVHTAGLLLLLAGGLCYTGGIVFYLWRRLPWNHALWHLWVLAGSVFHFLAVWFSLPAAP